MNLTVYCGANKGNDPAFQEAAKALGAWMAERGIGLVYGGGKIGIMGVIADEVLARGGCVTGVIPTFLRTREMAHEGVTTMIETANMSERKAKLLALGDGYIALPGGPGTLEEISEAYSAYRLHLHKKPCIVLNIKGCYDALETYFNDMAAHGFLSKEDRAAIHFVTSIEEISALMGVKS